MAVYYDFTETNIELEKFLCFSLKGPYIPKHRDIILNNKDKLRIVPYSLHVPDGTESIYYEIRGYVSLKKTFHNRKINWDELVLFLY